MTLIVEPEIDWPGCGTTIVTVVVTPGSVAVSVALGNLSVIVWPGTVNTEPGAVALGNVIVTGGLVTVTLGRVTFTVLGSATVTVGT